MQSLIEFPNARLLRPLLSPDGRYLSLFTFSGGGSAGQEGRLILVHRLADGHATWLAGTEQAEPLAWSPDSRSFAVVAGDEMKAIDIATSAIRTIGKVPKGLSPLSVGGSWIGHDILLGGSRLRRMSVVDGHVADVYRADPEVTRQYRPWFLPDGRRFLFLQESSDSARRGLFLGQLDSSEITRLLPEPTSAFVSPRGYLLYGQRGTLFAQRFDVERTRLVGDPVSIGSGLGFVGSFTPFQISGDTILWANATVLPPARLVSFDRNGRRLGEIGEVRVYNQIALAPDGQRALAEVEGEAGSRNSLFLLELARNIDARLTTGDQFATDPVWSPDSREVAFISDAGVVTRRIDQSGPKTLLTSPVSSLEAWTHDGRFLIYGLSSQSIWALPLGGDQKPIPIVEASSLVDEPRVSHDGRWLAYSASDTGRWEVYLQPFMRTGGRARVSTHGGGEPRWRADGKELFYMALDGAMMSADMTDQAKPGPARKLFDLRFWVNPVGDQYDVTADGQRFLVIVPEGQQATRLTVLTNWPSVLAGR